MKTNNQTLEVRWVSAKELPQVLQEFHERGVTSLAILGKGTVSLSDLGDTSEEKLRDHTILRITQPIREIGVLLSRLTQLDSLAALSVGLDNSGAQELASLTV